VLNVGAGAGSYEPVNREVTAVEPSASMRALRPAHLPQAINAVAEALPFADGAFDASMTTFSVHQWQGLERGLRELRRVTRGTVIVLSCDPDLVQSFWLNRYAPEVLRAELIRYPRIDTIARILGGHASVKDVPIPLLCRDGFNEAYYGRPEAFLVPDARLACSAWSFVPKAVAERSISHLKADLKSGDWDKRFGDLRSLPFFSGSLRLVVSHGAAI
jgi:SAM-dependent methyltransferase